MEREQEIFAVQKVFIKLIKDIFQICYDIKPHLEPKIELSLLSQLSSLENPTLENMIDEVHNFFTVPSAYYTDLGSKLFLDVIYLIDVAEWYKHRLFIDYELKVSPEQETFVKLIKDTFEVCYDIKPNFKPTIEPILFSQLLNLENPTLKNVKDNVLEVFLFSVNDNANLCSELLINVVELYTVELSKKMAVNNAVAEIVASPNFSEEVIADVSTSHLAQVLVDRCLNEIGNAIPVPEFSIDKLRYLSLYPWDHDNSEGVEALCGKIIPPLDSINIIEGLVDSKGGSLIDEDIAIVSYNLSDLTIWASQ